MSDQNIAIELHERTQVRKGLQSLRAEGMVPAVIHDHGNESIHTSGEYVSLLKAYSQAGKHHPVHLTVGGKKHLALIKDVDFEPTKHRLRHIVFQAIKQNETVSAEIPVVLVGDEIPAERASLIVLTQLTTVEVEALPANLPDELKVDATKLTQVGDRLTVADLQVPDKVTVMTDPDQTIATVEMPKDQIAEANAAAESLAADAGAPSEAEEQVVETPQSESEET